nr:hypothetical protein BpHYR1_016126 [Ipomoea batatas]GMC61596.1 hypothetical protein BpHYR1_016126 [Ipomoea batatas]
MIHLTNPPNRLRQALPEPCLYVTESWLLSSFTFISFPRANTRQAKPAAEEAKPAAVGKLL